MNCFAFILQIAVTNNLIKLSKYTIIFYPISEANLYCHGSISNPAKNSYS